MQPNSTFYIFFCKSRIKDQKVAYSSVDHQNRHRCQMTIVLDPGLVYGAEHGSLPQQGHDPLQYLGHIMEYIVEEHNFLLQPSLWETKEGVGLMKKLFFWQDMKKHYGFRLQSIWLYTARTTGNWYVPENKVNILSTWGQQLVFFYDLYIRTISDKLEDGIPGI